MEQGIWKQKRIKTNKHTDTHNLKSKEVNLDDFQALEIMFVHFIGVLTI
jgi:hypothetical protein